MQLIFQSFVINFPTLVQEKEYLVVANGRQPTKEWLANVAKNKVIYCVDGGIRYCKAANIIPQYLIGDADSAGSDWLWAKEKDICIDQYPVAKNATDLQIALQQVLEQPDCSVLVITGIWGGRFDHLYSAVFTIANIAQRLNKPVLLADQDEVMLIANAGTNVQINFLKVPQVISLLPLEEQANVSLHGSKWELERALLTQKDPYAISNQLKDDSRDITLTVHAGQVGLYYTFRSIQA